MRRPILGMMFFGASMSHLLDSQRRVEAVKPIEDRVDHTPWRPEAKRTRYEPSPSRPQKGKRKRQWR